MHGCWSQPSDVSIHAMDLKLTIFIFVTLGAGYWMILAGIQKRALQWRHPTRRCPSCGRLRRDCRCLA